ncbi:MAG: c-type cytochrome domain-containing protein, partial [Bacteroidota bacterium]
MPKIFTFAIIVICSLFFACQEQKLPENLPERVNFNFHIQPILSNNCYQCHGPDSSSRKANLRLDIEAIAKEALENGKYIIHAGNARKSKLIDRITSSDPDYQMPPPENGKPMNEREIALLKKWIDQGAEWKAYWAFEAPDLPNNKAF